MANSVFGTTGARRFWVFVGLWGTTITSIIFYITTPRAGGALSVLQIGGIFYYRSQVALNEFAAAATVPEWLVFLAYGILALILLAITVGVLVSGGGGSRSTGLSTELLLVMMVAGVVMVSAVFLTIMLSGATILTDTLGVVLEITPPILSLSPIAVGIAIVTASVP